jgi:hypothetical protein
MFRDLFAKEGWNWDYVFDWWAALDRARLRLTGVN